MVAVKILKTGYIFLFSLYLIFLVLLGFFLESENISNILFFGFEISANTDYALQDAIVLLRRKLDDIKPGGLGTFFIKQIMDDAVFKKDQQQWVNHLILTKKI